jgi:hypothetical protein
VARRRSQSSHSGAKEREGEGWNEVWNGEGWPAGVYIGPRPWDSCLPSTLSIPNSQTLDWWRMSQGKMVTFTNGAYTMNLTLEGTTWQKLRWILW